MLADGITVSRMVFSVLLLTFPVSSVPFAALYLLCGVSDILDGIAARGLRTESEKGAVLDSVADLVFAAAYAVKLLPVFRFPRWLWVWIGCIAAAKLFALLLTGIRRHGFLLPHSPANKLTGLLLFLLPFFAHVGDIRLAAAAVCAAASLAAGKELYIAITKGRFQ